MGSFDFGGRLRYHRNEPALGSPGNWNAAIGRARGDYIKLLHHDDSFADSSSLRKFVDLLDRNPQAGFGFCASRVLETATGVESYHGVAPRSLAALARNPAVLFAGNFLGVPSVTIYRRDCALPYDGRMKWLVDIDFYIRVLQSGAGFAYCEEDLVRVTSGAGHQVTTYCHDDDEVVLRESMLLFSKSFAALRDVPEGRESWFTLFERFRIHSLKALRSYCEPYPELRGYFLELLRRFRRQRLLSLEGLSRLISMRFPLPAHLSLFLRGIKHSLRMVALAATRAQGSD